MPLFKIRYNKRNKKHVLFQAPRKKGLWRIVKAFDSRNKALIYKGKILRGEVKVK